MCGFIESWKESDKSEIVFNWRFIKTGGKLSNGGKYFYLTQGEHINQNQTETYSETVDE